MALLDRIFLLATGLVAIYLIWRFYTRCKTQKALYDVYYLMGFIVLLVSGLLLIFLGYGILASPYVLTVASLIPLGISLGLMNQYAPQYKKIYAWFALVGILAIAISSIGGFETLKKISVPLFHGVAGLIIFILPIKVSMDGIAPKGFWWVGVGGALIGLGGIALAFSLSWLAITVLQPGFCAYHPGLTAFAHDPGLRLGLRQGYSGLTISWF